MPDFDSLPPGTFCWPELATTDQQAGVGFYRKLFGWDVNDQPMGPGETYSMFQMWQPKRHTGARILREPGALCWTELATRDTTAAKKFYTSLFGWKDKTS